jgi:hypothetical protein
VSAAAAIARVAELQSLLGVAGPAQAGRTPAPERAFADALSTATSDSSATSSPAASISLASAGAT